MQAFRQNVVEYMGGDDYGESRRRIHGLVEELLAMADERKVSDRDQNRKSVESLYLLLVPLIEASRIAHHRRTSNAEAHASI